MSVGPWILAARPKTLLAGVAPVIAGVALGAQVAGVVHWGAAIGCLLGAILIQIGCNFANDAFDALKGADDDRRIGPTRAVAAGLISARGMLVATGVVLAAALAVGIYLATIGGWPILALGVVSLICAVAYTGGPFPLAYHGLGDLFVFLFFGLFAVLGSAFLQALVLEPHWWYVAAALGLQGTAIIAVNNIRDRETDEKVGKNTLAVRMGDRKSRVYHSALHMLAVGCLLMAFPQNSAPALVALIGGAFTGLLVMRLPTTRLNTCLGLNALVEMATALAIWMTL